MNHCVQAAILSLLLALGGADVALAQAARSTAAAAPADASQSGSIAAQVDTSGYFEARTGAGLYATICQGCHMPDARGAAGAGVYPALAGNRRLASGAYATMLVLQGHRAMPAFGGNLTDSQVAAVVTYVRTHFGNSYTDTVTPGMVKAIRAAHRTGSGKAASAG